MTALVLAALAGSLAAAPGPLPDGRSIDTLSYTFATGIAGTGPGGFLSIAADGKVRYSHATAPSTGSGGVVTQQEWTLTKEERTDLFRKLVADGLLDIPESKKPILCENWFTVTSGRWRFTIQAGRVPDKVMTHLRPVLAKAHPALWAEEKPVEKAERPKLTLFRYGFAQRPGGSELSLTVARDGTVVYRRETPPNLPDDKKVIVADEWKIPAKDAAALLDALVADGLFDLKDNQRDPPEPKGPIPALNPPKKVERPRVPRFIYSVDAQAGRWHTSFSPPSMPEQFLKHFRPHMKKADPEFWK